MNLSEISKEPRYDNVLIFSKWPPVPAQQSTHALGSQFGHSLHAALQANHIEVFYHVTTFKIFSLIRLIYLVPNEPGENGCIIWLLGDCLYCRLNLLDRYDAVQCTINFVRKVDFEEKQVSLSWAACRSSSMEGRFISVLIGKFQCLTNVQDHTFNEIFIVIKIYYNYTFIEVQTFRLNSQLKDLLTRTSIFDMKHASL